MAFAVQILILAACPEVVNYDHLDPFQSREFHATAD
jgi:hypothetical protein